MQITPMCCNVTRTDSKCHYILHAAVLVFYAMNSLADASIFCGVNASLGCLPCYMPTCAIRYYIGEPFWCYSNYCNPGCLCNFGYIRLEARGDCVAYEDCPKPHKMHKPFSEYINIDYIGPVE